MFETLDLTIEARGVARVRLNRPEVHNAMSARMMDELRALADQMAQDPGVRVVVLTGAGPSFCAGGDLRWMQAQIGASPPERAVEARRLAGMLGALNEMPKPLIGHVNGGAFGGGIGLMAVCDVAIGLRDASFALSETRLGLIPATIGPYVLARMGEGRARRVFMNARRFDGTEAVALGLLARAVPPEALEAAVEAEITPYLSCAPGAVAAAKAQTRALGLKITEATIEASIAALSARWSSDEAEAGLAAFFAKRPPPWSG